LTSGTEAPQLWDVIIVGGGPAGLNAALVLGRACRRVLLCDRGDPRNRYSHAMHGFLSRDGTDPAELRRISREQLARYSNVEIRDVAAAGVRCEGPEFGVDLSDGATERARKLILATGLIDVLPELPGLLQYYGRGVFNCPYCDGWEVRDRRLAVYARGRAAKAMALEIRGWSDDLIVFAENADELSAEDRERLQANAIRLREEPVSEVVGDGERFTGVRLATGEVIERDALFVLADERPATSFAERLGCATQENGVVKTGSYEKTEIEGLFVVGDASRRVNFAIVAAAEGAMAAFACNTQLLKEQLR
jgi:thioredoxin reductase